MLFPRSLRWRIQLWHTLLLAVIVTTLLVIFYKNQREILYQNLDRELTQPITRLLPKLGRPPNSPPPRRRNLRDPDFPDEPGFERGPRRGGPGRDSPGRRPEPRGRDDSPSLDEVVTELADEDIYAIVWEFDGELRFASPNAPDELPPISSIDPPDGDRFKMRSINGFREAIHANPRGGLLICGTSLAPIDEKLEALAKQLTFTGIGLVAGGFVIGWLLISRSLRPIRDIGHTAHQVAAGHLDERISIRQSSSELGSLSTVLNDTFEKLDSSFAQQVRFTADASHEMRTPIAVILAKCQHALAREREPARYQEALQTCLNSAQHMRELTEALLELARFDSGESKLDRQPGDLAELAREVLDLVKPLANDKKISLSSNLPSAPAQFDASKIRQALLNLLGNAIKHHHGNGKVSLSIQSNDEGHLLTLSDDGPGIPKEDLPHLFDRFYQVDRARTRHKKSGTGLGLAITRAVIEAHKGSIKVESTPGDGTTFFIRLPR